MPYKTVKFSSPNWSGFGYNNIGIIGQTPNNLGLWGDYKFEINNDCDECDYWIIYSSTAKKEKVNVPKGNTIFITSEEIEQHYYHPKYVAQFDKIVTSRSDIPGNNVIKNYYINAWFVRKTYNQLKESGSPKKTKQLSLIASNLTVLPGHKDRFAFIHKMIGHFKDKIDVFGRGHNFVHDKWDALADYKYSIAIENAQIPDYFTEKIVDCFLAETMPIYFGCPNITDYFVPESMELIDIYDYKKSILQIEELVEGNLYDKLRPILTTQKNNVLDELQFFPYVCKILDTLKVYDYKKSIIFIHPEKKYIDTYRFKNNLFSVCKDAITLIK